MITKTDMAYMAIAAAIIGDEVPANIDKEQLRSDFNGEKTVNGQISRDGTANVRGVGADAEIKL